VARRPASSSPPGARAGQDLTPGDLRFISLDDLDALELARRDPEALVEGSPVTLDEREPDLLGADTDLLRVLPLANELGMPSTLHCLLPPRPRP
jgi:hypothetical protein